MLARELQAHLDRLAAALGCEMKQGAEKDGMMFVEYSPPMIEGPELLVDVAGVSKYPDLSTRYYIMLHELGHVYHGHTQGRPGHEDQTFYFDNGVLRSEAQAWRYALETALYPPSHACADFARHFCIGSYWAGAKRAGTLPTRLWNGNRHWVEFVFDEPDDEFLEVIETLDELIEREDDSQW